MGEHYLFTITGSAHDHFCIGDIICLGVRKLYRITRIDYRNVYGIVEDFEGAIIVSDDQRVCGKMYNGPTDKTAGILHRCLRSPDHEGPCKCFCGASFNE